MIETNDSVTKLERIKDKPVTVFSEKSLYVVGEKHEETLSTFEDEFKVNLEENSLSKWHESQGTTQ
jgi:hypothetical protein